MTNDIFTKKTPLVLAVGAALSLGVQTAWAADEEPTHHALTLGDGKNNTFHSVIDSEESSITLPDDFQDYFNDYFNDQAQDDDGKWAKGDVIDVKGVTGTSTIDSVTIKTNGSLTIGSNVGALVFDKATVKNINIEGGTFSNGSVTYLEGASLTATGGTFKNTGTLKVGIDYVPVTSGDDAAGEEEVTLNGDSLTMKVGGTTAFTNSGTIELGDGVNFGLKFNNPTSSQAGDGENADKYTAGSFDNSKGKIVVGTGTFTIAASTVKEGEPEGEVVYDEKPEDLPTYSMGTIIVNGGKLVNENTGYLVAGEKENEDDENVPDPVRNTLVDFGDVTLNNGTFTSATGARETGDKLTLNGTKASASFAGYSEWDSIVLNLAALEDEEATQEEPSDSAKSITVNADGVLKIGKITLENLTSGSDPLSLSNYVEAKSGDDGHGTKAGSVTVTDTIAVSELRGDSAGKFEVDAGALKTANIDVSGAALSISNEIKYEKTTRKNFSWEEYLPTGDGEKTDAPNSDKGSNLFEAVAAGDIATLSVKGYKASWEVTEAKPEDENSKATGAWETASIGSISAGGTSQLEITGLRTGTDAVDSSATVKPTEDAVYTASVSSISLSENWFTATADVDVAELKPEDENANADDLVDGKWDETKYSTVVGKIKEFIAVNGDDEGPATLGSTISGSDLEISTLKIEKTVKNIDLAEYKVDGDTEDNKWQISKDSTSTEITTDAVQHTAVTLDITDSRLRIGEFTQETGTLTIGSETGDLAQKVSEVIIDSVGTMDGTLSFKSGMLALNANNGNRETLINTFLTESSETPAVTVGAKWVYIGDTVTLGENAKVAFGKAWDGIDEPSTMSEDTTEKVGSQVSIGSGTVFAFDSCTFYSNGLLAGTGDDAVLQIDISTSSEVQDTDKIQFISQNSAIGTFNLSQGFKLVDAEGKELTAEQAEKVFDASKITVDAAWGLTDEEAEKAQSYVNEKGQIIVGDVNQDGQVTVSDYRSLSDVAATNLVNNVLAGNRGDTIDQSLINAFLSRVHQRAADDTSDTIADYSAAEAVREINSMTQFAAVSALKAMTVDFSGYVQDQIEHHAYTIPHEMRGWWVQPIGARLKTDDLRAGNLTTGYSLDTYGIMGGYDWTVPNGDIWGIAASYQSGDADGEGNALAVTSDVSATSFHIWAARHIGDLRVMGAFTYMKSDADATMSTSLGSLSSDELAATAVSFGMRADLTKTYGNFKLVPHAGARVSMVDMDDFTVTYQNTYEAFKYSEDKAWIFEVPVGVTAATSFEYQRWNVQPYVDLTVRGRFGDTDATTTVTGVGSGVSDKVKYDVSGDVIGDLRVGYMSTFQNLNLGMSYGFSAGDAGRQNHTFEATLRIDL